LVIWIGQVHTNSEIETDEAIIEQAKILGQQIRVTNSAHTNLYIYFAPKKN
jgi:hypothetical protein